VTFEELLTIPQYSLPQAGKDAILLGLLNELTSHHRRHCPDYDRLVSVLRPGYESADSVAELPFLPVSLFKSHALRSVPESEVFKVLTSSGTTGQEVSRIVLNRETAQRQTLALVRIMSHILGPARLPMILVESPDLIKDRRQFSARGAGLLGMMNFGRNHLYVLDSEMQLNEAALREFLERHPEGPILIFGFTFMVWRYLFQAIENRGIDLSRAILVHSGGWKKLQEMAVTNAEFRRRFAASTGLTHIYNFYGMVEQVGSVFVEGEDGYLYAPNYADVIVRNPVTWREAAIGETGVIQVLSVLPLSYPGHSLMTEDLGVVHGIDDSTCGRKGKRFSVVGRVARTELRGCSDTHAAQAVQ
jgi:hypothetical protein